MTFWWYLYFGTDSNRIHKSRKCCPPWTTKPKLDWLWYYDTTAVVYTTTVYCISPYTVASWGGGFPWGTRIHQIWLLLALDKFVHKFMCLILSWL